MMVVKLNMILITSPELADFRRRLKNLDSKVDALKNPCRRTNDLRTVKCYSPRCIGRGVTMPLLSSPFAFWRRHMNTRQTCCRSCKFPPIQVHLLIRLAVLS